MLYTDGKMLVRTVPRPGEPPCAAAGYSGKKICEHLSVTIGRYFRIPENAVVRQVIKMFEASSSFVTNEHCQLQPDLILLDIGLSTRNGIEALTRIRGISPTSKILFVSENRSVDIAEKALHTGAGGYVVNSDAAKELPTPQKPSWKVSGSLAPAWPVSFSPPPWMAPT
jgi:CheY-like chemotaxis protein